MSAFMPSCLWKLSKQAGLGGAEGGVDWVIGKWMQLKEPVSVNIAMIELISIAWKQLTRRWQ